MTDQLLAYYRNLSRQLQAVIDYACDEIFVTDGQGTVILINPAGAALYGVAAEEMIGQNTELLAQKGFYAPSFFSLIKERKEKVSMIQKTRSGRIIHCIGNPVVDENGQLQLVVFTSRDLTEIKQLQDRIRQTERQLAAYEQALKEFGIGYGQEQEHDSSDQPAAVAFSPHMKRIYQLAKKIAKTRSTVLITGETGVGKGRLARYIHEHSGRRGRFVEINCGAIPDALIEAELFGYERGAFTGAQREGKPGLFEAAEGGTVFLDEIGELPLHLQVKLLHVLETNRFQRVGGTRPVQVDVRIIAATNRDLEQMVAEGRFRPDLYYRLNVILLHLPPLRERREDIAYFIDYFLDHFNNKYQTNKVLSLSAENALLHYDWPGNIRELENMIERLVLITEEREIGYNALPASVSGQTDKLNAMVQIKGLCPLKEAVAKVEKQLVTLAYQRYRSSYKVAEVLGINQSTAYRKIQKYIHGDDV